MLERLVDKIFIKGFGKDLYHILEAEILRTPWKELKKYEKERDFFSGNKNNLKERFSNKMRQYSEEDREKFFDKLMKKYIFYKQHPELLGTESA